MDFLASFFFKIIDLISGGIAVDRQRKKISRYELLTKILEILSEGSDKSWKKKPNDMRHIHFIARQIALEDSELNEKFTHLIDRWNICANKSSTIGMGVFTYGEGFPPEKVAQFEKTEELVKELQKELEVLDKEISEKLKKWRK